MTKSEKKSVFKRWWFWVIAFIVFGFFVGIFSDDEEEADNEAQEEVEEVDAENNSDESAKDEPEDNSDKKESESDEGNSDEENKPENKDKEDENLLTDEELKEIEEEVKDQMVNGADEQENDFQFHMEDFEYDDDNNTVSYTIFVDDDPLPPKEEVEEYPQDIAWYTGEAIIDKNFEVRVTTTFKFDEDEYALMGHAYFKDGETSFKEEKGIQLFD